jgi:hypothetical protein
MRDDRYTCRPPYPDGALGHRRAVGGRILINYFDWINLSVGGPQLQQEFGLTDSEPDGSSAGSSDPMP